MSIMMDVAIMPWIRLDSVWFKTSYITQNILW